MRFKKWTSLSAAALSLVGGMALATMPIPSEANTPIAAVSSPLAKGGGATPDSGPIDLTKAIASPSPAVTDTPLAPPKIPGVPDRLLAKALASFQQHRGDLSNASHIGIVDYAAHSSEPRFYIVDLEKRTARALRVTHGSGSDRDHDGYLDRFSDQDGSNATSRGAYRTAEVYDGKYGRAERLDGLDDSNRTARDRAIVMHHAWYAEPDVVTSQKKLGRSQGCFTFSAHDLPEVMDALPPGSLIYADKI